MDSNGTGDPAREDSLVSNTLTGKTKDSERQVTDKSEIGRLELLQTDERSGSQSKPLSGRVLFYEQVWQGGADVPESDSSITITAEKTATGTNPSTSSHRIRESVKELERKLEEKKKQRSTSTGSGSDTVFERVTLRKTPSREYIYSSSDTINSSSVPISQINSMSRNTKGTHPIPEVPAFVRQNTAPYEDVFEARLGDHGVPGTSLSSSSSRDEIGRSSGSQGSHSSISRTTTTSIISHSSGSTGQSVVIRKTESKSQFIPGGSSIKYEALGADDLKRKNILSSTDSSNRLEVVSPGSRKLAAKIAKYEFLSAGSDVVQSHRSRTPSGDTTNSSKSYATTSSRTGSPYPEHTSERVKTPLFGKIPTSETSSFHSAQSPTDLSSLSESSRIHYAKSTDSDLNVLHASSPSPLSRKRDVFTNVEKQSFSAATNTTTVGTTVLKKVEKSLLDKEKSFINSPDSVEWYAEYKSKFGKNFELGLSKSAKNRSDYFDSHIADVRGKNKL